MPDFDTLNVELQIYADEMREEMIELQYEELLMQEELQRQYEAMQRSAEMEDFSPFDTCNS